MEKMRKEKGITLIALVITIIVLLILAGVSVVTLVGENGIISRTSWAKFVTNFNEVQEQTDIYAIGIKMEKYGYRNKVASTSTIITKLGEEKEIYPIKGEKISNDSLEESLKETIETLENVEINEEDVELYEIDNKKIDIKTEEEYVVNVKSGKIYLLKAFKFKGKLYHRPDWGANNSTKIKISMTPIDMTEKYQFYTTEGNKVDIEFRVNLPEELKDATVNVNVITTAKGNTSGTYKDGKYTGTITTNITDNPNGVYTYEIIVSKDGEEYTASRMIEVTKFLENPTIEIIKPEDDSYSSFTIKVTNDKKEANLKYKYYVKKNKETDYATVNFEKITSKEITNREPSTKYDIKVEAWLDDESDHSETTSSYTTPEQISKIYTINDLEKVNTTEGLSGNWKLMNDLDFTNASSYKNGETDARYIYYNQKDASGNLLNSWTPIGSSSTPFIGKFDGNYNTISNLYIGAGLKYRGMFAYIDGTTSYVVIKNLVLDHFVIYGTGSGYNTGSLAAYIKSSATAESKEIGSVTLSRVKVSNLTFSNGPYGGFLYGDSASGITGDYGATHVLECSVVNSKANSTTNAQYISGIGRKNAKLSDCYVDAEEVRGAPCSVLASAVTNFYANIKTNYKKTWGITNTNTTTAGSSIKASFWNSSLAPNITQKADFGGSAKTDTQMKDIKTYSESGWNISGDKDGDSIWYFGSDVDYPILRWELGIK